MTDKFKDTERILYNYKNIDTLNRLDELKIKRLENDINLGALSYEEKGSKTYKISSSVESETIYRDEHIKPKIDKLKKDIQDRKIEKEIIEESLHLLEYEERRIVELRYFSKPQNSWIAISIQLGIDTTSLFKKRANIINKLIFCLGKA